jgi:hypothetical protein
MKIKASFQIPELNVQGYVNTLSEELADALSRAAFEYIGAATAEIPVWSGASHATFLHLAREIGFNLSIPEANNAPRRVSYGLRNSSGSFEADRAAGRFSFTYETHLKHLVYNEFNNANIDPDPGLFAQLLDPGPYEFQAAGRNAVSRIFAHVRLPDARRFVKVKKRQV